MPTPSAAAGKTIGRQETRGAAFRITDVQAKEEKGKPTDDGPIGSTATARLGSLIRGSAFSHRLVDSVAAVAMETRNAAARIRFGRSVSLNKFLGGIRDNLRKAREAGIVAGEQYDSISSSLPRWCAFLADRKIHDGDELLYRIRGDSLHTVFRDADGKVLLDQVNVGPERRLSVLGGYFASGSDFRKGLMRSQFSGSEKPGRR